jgi:ELWxxDGT repeat protein
MRARYRLLTLTLLALARPALGQSGVPAPVDVTLDWAPSMLTVYEGALYFRADGPGAGGLTLWSYDARTGQAHEAFPLDPFDEGRAPNMAVYDGRLYFGTPSPEGDWSELVAYDASTGFATQHPLDTLAAAINSLTVLDGQLYFVAYLRSPVAGCSSGGTQVWAFDAATQQGAPVTELCPGLWDGSGRSLLVAYAGRLFFQADDDTHGRELWAYDPAAGTAALVADLAPGSAESFPGHLTVYDGRLFFTASSDLFTDGVDLWAYDAATNTVAEVADVHAPGGGAPPSGLTVYGGRLFFAAGAGATGSELWAYDAAADTTGLVAEIAPGSQPAAPQGFAVYHDVLYFSAVDGVHGQELWAYDAATDSTRMVFDLNADASASPGNLTVYDGRLYFSAFGDVPGAYLWSFETPATDAEGAPPAGTEPFTLSPARPNPLRTSAALTLAVSTPQHVRVEVFDVLGRPVALLYDGPVSAALPHTLTLDAAALAGGVYAVRAAGERSTATRSVTVHR